MASRCFRAIICSALLAAGALFLFATMNRSQGLLDLDEAAWIFNGAYLDLYLSGDWHHPDWRAFEQYAQHPPAGSYLFGLLLHAVGEPMKSMEPRRFWFEHDLDQLNFPEQFFRGISERLTSRQLLAGRSLAASFAWLVGVALFFLAYRFAGPLAGGVSFVLLLLHPAFRGVATLATADTFILLLSVLIVLLAFELGRAAEGRPRRLFLLAAPLAIVLGISFASKIIAYLWLPAAAIAAAGGAVSRRGTLKALAAAAIAAAAGFGIAVLLDPGMQGAPLSTLVERVAWRTTRIEIQQMVFVGAKIATVAGRLLFATYHAFFSSPQAAAMLVLCAAGAGALFLPSVGAMPERRRTVVLAVVLFFSLLTILSLPLAWPRYVAADIPFLALLAGVGAAFLRDVIRQRRLTPASAKAAFSGLLALAVFVAITGTWAFAHGLSPMPPEPTPGEVLIARKIAFSLDHAGVDVAVHRDLLEYFEGRGDAKWAAYERHWLLVMEKGQQGK